MIRETIIEGDGTSLSDVFLWYGTRIPLRSYHLHDDKTRGRIIDIEFDITAQIENFVWNLGLGPLIGARIDFLNCLEAKQLSIRDLDIERIEKDRDMCAIRFRTNDRVLWCT